MSWAKVELEEIRKAAKSMETESKGDWYWGHEVDATMPEPVAHALKKTLRGTDQHRAYPGAENASAEDLPCLEQFVIMKDSWAEKASQ
eukprot:3179773-Pyramimonas_sp.AAC.1